MGAREMLEAAGEIGSPESLDVFVQGRNPSDGKFIRLNLERDHVPLSDDVENGSDIKISAEIDSFNFVGQQIRVLQSVKVYVTVGVSKHPPIRRHNHIYVELLLPPS